MLDKSKPTDKEVQARNNHFEYVFQKDKRDSPQEPQDGAPKTGTDGTAAGTDDLPPVFAEEYAQRLVNLRTFIQDLAVPRMREVFRQRAKKTVGKMYTDCETLEDYLNEYKHGTYDNNKRMMVHTLCNLMWGKNCIQWIEKMVMDKLGMVYVNLLIASGKPVSPKTRRTAGSIAKMIARMRQTLFCDRFR